MKYAFVKLESPTTHEDLYMSPADFYRYCDKEIFQQIGRSVVIFDNIYIAAFNLFERLETIKQFNEDADIILELPLASYLHYVSNQQVFI